MSRHLPWGKRVTAPETAWKEYTYPTEPKEIPFMEWLKGFVRKHMNAGWIPVEERLPEEPKENPEFKRKKIELYLVAKQGTKYPFRGFWNGKFFTDGWSKCEVIAWRHLPEPYRPESKTGQSDWRADMLRKFDRRSRQ